MKPRSGRKISFRWKAAMVLLAMALLLTGCYGAELYTYTCITSDTGAGYKSIYAVMLKDGAIDPEENTVINDNNHFLPKGPQGVLEWLEDNVPEGFTVELIEEELRNIFVISFTFDSMEEYNEKSRQLMGDERWTKMMFKDTELVVSDAGNGQSRLAWTEETELAFSTGIHYFSQIYENPDIFEKHLSTIVEAFLPKYIFVQFGNGEKQAIDMHSNEILFTVEGTLPAGETVECGPISYETIPPHNLEASDPSDDPGSVEEPPVSEPPAEEQPPADDAPVTEPPASEPPAQDGAQDGAGSGGDSAAPPSDRPQNPQTGDAGYTLNVILALLSALALAWFVFARKWRKQS